MVMMNVSVMAPAAMNTISMMNADAHTSTAPHAHTRTHRRQPANPPIRLPAHGGPPGRYLRLSGTLAEKILIACLCFQSMAIVAAEFMRPQLDYGMLVMPAPQCPV